MLEWLDVISIPPTSQLDGYRPCSPTAADVQLERDSCGIIAANAIPGRERRPSDLLFLSFFFGYSVLDVYQFPLLVTISLALPHLDPVKPVKPLS